jgi:hypothetical protein
MDINRIDFANICKNFNETWSNYEFGAAPNEIQSKCIKEYFMIDRFVG